MGELKVGDLRGRKGSRIRRELEAAEQDDRIESLVRQRLRGALAGAGVDRGRVEQEILFMLPPEFVRFYRALHMAGLDTGERSGEAERVAAETGRRGIEAGRKGKVAGASGRPERGERAGRSVVTGGEGELAGKAGGGGLKAGRDAERALEIRRAVDRGLKDLVQDALSAWEFGGLQCSGERCRAFVKAGWRHCPRCGRSTSWTRTKG